MSYQRNMTMGATPAKPPAAGGALTAAYSILTDPALSEVSRLVGRLHALEVRRAAGAPPGSAASSSAGIGLRDVVKPLRAYVYAEEHPWVKPLAVAAVLGVPFLFGYLTGKRA